MYPLILQYEGCFGKMIDNIHKRILELASRVYNENRYVYTDFLNIAELSEFYEMRDAKHEFDFVKAEAFGGMEDCERCIVRFGDEELCGYEEEYPITLLEVKPVAAKFADDLSHRDYLGSVMGLGIEREKTGDIYILDNCGYIFVPDAIADYIIANLEYVKHTKVKVRRCEKVPDGLMKHFTEEEIIVASERADAVISAIYKLSRDASLELFRGEKVYINGRICTSNSKTLKDGDTVSVRGYGKFDYKGECGTTRKSKLYVKIAVRR